MNLNRETVQRMVNIVANTPAVLESLVAPLSEDQFEWQPDAENWSVRQTIEHLYETDNFAFAGRIEYIMGNDGGVMPRISPEERAREKAPTDCSKAELLKLFRERREANSARARGFAPDKLNATVTYRGKGAFSAWDFLLEWPYHDHSHMNQIGDIIKAQVIPGFSPTMAKALGVS